MATMTEYMEMGGYAAYIWPSYGISALILICLVIFSFRRLRKIENELAPLEQNRKSRRRKKTMKEGAVL